ncbi:MAG: DUF1440 domain-containing protein [Gammaproteobacteria bacterium]
MTARPSAWRAIVRGGLVAGVMDIAAAFVVYGLLYGISPVRILQSISSGLLGLPAYDGGPVTVVLGGLLHFSIMLVICAVYVLASRRLAFLTNRAVVSGVLYGIAVYLVMSFVVLPLSAYPHPVVHPISNHLISVAIQIVCVGLPIALVVSRSTRNAAPGEPGLTRAGA